MATQMAEAFSCKATMETVAIVQAVVNAPEPTAVVTRAIETVMGPEVIVPQRTMASEDMGYFLDEIPGCYFFIGAGNEEAGFGFPHHHPRFDFDERAMKHGVAVMGEAVAHYVFPSGEASAD